MKMRQVSFIFMLLLSLAICVSPAGAQTHASGTSAPAEKKSVPEGTDTRPSHGAASQQLTETTNEAAGRPNEAQAEHGKQAEGDETAAFRQSPAVRFIARTTGLSLEGAYWLSIGINFLIVVVLAVVFLKSKLPKVFRCRTEEIQRSMAEARRASEDAGRRLAAIEERLSKLGQSISEMQSHADAESQAEERRIWASAEEEKRKIVEGAEQEIAAAANAAQRELKLLAVELALATAEKQIKVDSKQDKQLVQDFAEQLRNTADGKR